MIRLVRFCGAVAAAVVLSALIIAAAPKMPLLAGYDFSTAFYDRNGKLLRLELTEDDKYRLRVKLQDIPENMRRALLLYEDRWFYYHPGVNPWRMLEAAANMAVGGRKQGASTITMQVARIVYRIDSSTPWGKIKQILRALQLELMYSKDEILEAYFNLAPYGGNIEGIGAAALIYFGIDAKNLNLLQSIMLTVVPQNPTSRSLSTDRGLKEAEKAAQRLKEKWLEVYPQTDKEILCLPLKPMKNLPFAAPHLIQRLKNRLQGNVVTTIDINLQKKLQDLVREYVAGNRHKGLYNAAAMIVDVKSGEVLASVGSADFFAADIQGQVDGTRALRSPGSVLKPFIYGLALEQGIIHPLSMLEDVPRNYGLYTPENFDHAFYGLVNATEALINSRNVPAVDLLKKLRSGSFYQMLRAVEVPELKPEEFYGLALALGGAEVTMENLAGLYVMLGNGGEFIRPKYVAGERTFRQRLLSREAAYLVLKMLRQNPPPDEEVLPYQTKNKRQSIAWKTGTSYGFRDAWTAGVAGNYAIIVWVGNFDGTGNHHFVGRTAAAPLFFNIVRRADVWVGFSTDTEEADNLNIRQVDICQNTGELAAGGCPQTVLGDFIPGVTSIKMSHILRQIPVNVKTGLRACRHKPPQTKLEWFEFWPSEVKKALAEAGINFKEPPAFEENCSFENTSSGRAPKIIFPAAGSIIISRMQKGRQEEVPLRASADADVKKIYWFVNQRLVGETQPDETLTAELKIGINKIKAVDNLGREQEIGVRVKSEI